jgi:hypothetical protein
VDSTEGQVAFVEYMHRGVEVADQTQPAGRAAWRPKQWRKDLGEDVLSDSQFWAWIADGTIRSVKVGGCRLIVESPAEFTARHAAAAP